MIKLNCDPGKEIFDIDVDLEFAAENAGENLSRLVYNAAKEAQGVFRAILFEIFEQINASVETPQGVGFLPEDQKNVMKALVEQSTVDVDMLEEALTEMNRLEKLSEPQKGNRDRTEGIKNINNKTHGGVRELVEIGLDMMTAPARQERLDSILCDDGVDLSEMVSLIEECKVTASILLYKGEDTAESRWIGQISAEDVVKSMNIDEMEVWLRKLRNG